MTGLTAAGVSGQKAEDTDVFFLAGEGVTLRVLDDEEVLVVTVVLQDRVKLVVAAWHEPT
jgi:hypothetical protein